MNGTNLFKIALRALNNNKLRAFLTMLGIIIGVASVITMLAIGQGSKKSIQAQISEMGSNMIMIHPGADMRGGVRQDPSAMQTLKLTDYEALRNETNFLAAVSPNVSSSGQLIAGNNNYPSSVSGVGTDYLEIRQLSVENNAVAARKVSEEADKSQAAVASRTAAEIYGLKVLAEGINHNRENTTRFLILSKHPVYRKDADKVSICFELPHESGTLYNMLNNFAFSHLNMRMIESRPIPGRNWEYRFFVDIEGNLDDPDMINALKGIAGEANHMRILGNY